MRYNSFALSGLFGQVHFFIMKTYNNVALSGIGVNLRGLVEQIGRN
jgi:hypothetical protein